MSRTLIAGLGNPGRKYAGTRHNIGFAAVEELARRQRLQIGQSKFDGLFATGAVCGVDVVLLKPQTFMNKSGRSILAARQFFDIAASDTIVMHDDIDLDCGVLRLKKGGGHGGHNGLRHIIACTGDRDFPRVRLGIGRPEHDNVTAHVLGRFDRSEEALVAELIEDACDAVELILTDGVEAAQNRFHAR